MFGRVALLLALACVVAAESQVKVLHTPGGMKFAESGSVTDVQVGDMLKASLGLSAPEQSALVSSNLFKRAQATVLVGVLGFDDELSSKGSETAPTFTVEQTSTNAVTSIRSMIGGSTATPLASALADTLGHGVASVSASFNDDVANAVASTDSHVVTVVSNSIHDSMNTFSANSAAIESEMASQVLGNDTRYDAKNKMFILQVNGRDLIFSMRSSQSSDFITELHMLARTARLAAAGLATDAAAPAVFSFVVSRYAAVAGLGGDLTAPKLLVSRLLTYIVSQFATASKCNLLVVAAGVTGTVPAPLSSPSVERVEAEMRRRGVGVQAGGLGDIIVTYPRDRDTATYCVGYKCYCNRDSNGTAFDPDTNCNAACLRSDKKGCECSYYPCNCASNYTQVNSAVCTQCQKGFFLQNGRCYVDSNYPVMVNIWLWLGLLALLGLLSTCYVIGDMDPGRNNIVYRMTSQKPKIH